PGLPVPLSSPLAGLTRPIRIREPPKPKQVDRWTEKRALFGVYDNVGILDELQRCIRKKKVVGDRMFVEDYHNLKKRIRFLYKRFNRYGKHR
ncbi:hypothetical protein N331_10089, partial [Merops nubicus]